MVCTTAARTSPLTAEQEALVLQWRYLPKRIASRLVQTDYRIARLLNIMEMDDLVATGNIGLVKAARAWDPDRGVGFSTLAWHCIRNAIGSLPNCRRQREPEEQLSWEENLPGRSEAEEMLDREAVGVALDKLDDRSRQFVQRYFGLGSQPQTFRQIASDVGISTERVRQVIKRALGKLANHLEPAC